jgi:uncharacterized pyridoxamine 5'-phosphate oxidase family protein
MSDGTNKDLEFVEQFIASRGLAAMATVTHDALPEVAIMGYKVLDDSRLFIGTFRDSRKYQNLKENPRVAFAIGWEGGKTVQLEGEAYELSGDELETAKAQHLASMPTAAKFVAADQAVFFAVTKKWAKYTDLSKDPWEEIEVRY